MIHLAADTTQAVIALKLTAVQRADSPQLGPVLDRIAVPRPRAGLAGRKDQRANRKAKGRLGGRPPAFERETYKQRNTVERSISRLERYRTVSTRYDSLRSDHPSRHHSGLETLFAAGAPMVAVAAMVGAPNGPDPFLLPKGSRLSPIGDLVLIVGIDPHSKVGAVRASASVGCR
jgi:transposase